MTARLVITYFNWLWRHALEIQRLNGLNWLTSLGYGPILLPIPLSSDAQPICPPLGILIYSSIAILSENYCGLVQSLMMYFCLAAP